MHEKLFEMKISIKQFTVTAFALLIVIYLQSVSALSTSCTYTGPPAPVKGEAYTQIRILSMNVQGQKPTFESEQKCETRLTTIGENIANISPSFDIVGLTEVHPDYAVLTCNGKKLVDAIQSRGEYLGNKARWGHPETSFEEYDGGTSLFSRTVFSWSPYERHVHRFTPTLFPRTAHGFIFSRIPLSSGLELDVYVVHIHSTSGIGNTDCNQQCKVNELEQLAEGIHERSANSGNPVLVMGDFNIGGPNPTQSHCEGNTGYGDIMNLLRHPRDVWLEAHPDLTGSTHGDERIDFMFLLTDPYFTNSPYELVISDPQSVRLINWSMPGFRKRGTWHQGPFKVSDHLGLEATFGIQRRLGWGVLLPVLH